MTSFDQHALRGTSLAIAPRLSRAIETLAARFTAKQKRRATRRALEQLSDSELDDIGLCRGDIYRLY